MRGPDRQTEEAVTTLCHDHHNRRVLVVVLVFVRLRRGIHSQFFFQAGAHLSIENTKLWPVLAIFCYFVTDLRTFLCPFYRPK